MGVPAEQMTLIDASGKKIDVDALMDNLKSDSDRVLADDEIGCVIYVGDLEVYALKPTDSGEFLVQHVTEISRVRFSTAIIRKQIGATVLSVTSDAIFVVRDGNTFKKVRAEKLQPGMVLATGEKVYR